MDGFFLGLLFGVCLWSLNRMHDYVFRNKEKELQDECDRREEIVLRKVLNDYLPPCQKK